MIWAILALIILVVFFGWWGLLWFALLVGFFMILLMSGKPPVQPVRKSNPDDFYKPTSTENGIKCPKCDSTQITAAKKGFSAGQAIAGGIIGGAIGMNKIKITCLRCGNVFNPGDGN